MNTLTAASLEELPENLRHIYVGNKDVYILGTAHVSSKSVEEVKMAASSLDPDSICVELCQTRYTSLMERNSWQLMDIFRVIREKKAFFLLIQLVMTAFYRKLGEKLRVRPGAELLEGIQQARQLGADLVLADREVNITLRRVWGYLSFWYKIKLFSQLLLSIFYQKDLDEELVENLKEKDQLEVAMDSVAQSFPEIKTRLIDERDKYLAQKIRDASGETILAVVGIGHLQGILEYIHSNIDIDSLLQAPPKSRAPQIIKWLIPSIIVFLIILGFFQGGAEHSIRSILIWVLVNGVFSALGVSLALAHPLTILATFFAAPLTSLNPTIAAGWVSGLTQALFKKPTVGDLERLSTEITSLKGFWFNPVSRILLVVVLANLGSSVGTFLAGGWITTRIF